MVCLKMFNGEIIFHLKRVLKRLTSSRPEVFCKKGVLRNFTKFTGKHLCQSLFFNKVAGLRPATLLKKRLWHMCFPVNVVKFLRTPFYTEHLWWLLLKIVLLHMNGLTKIILRCKAEQKLCTFVRGTDTKHKNDFVAIHQKGTN